VLRSLAFQACFVSATAVAARTSTEAVGAHQVVWQLWTFLSLVLDSVAIAAQSLVGAALGAREARRAQAIAAQIVRYGLIFGCVLGVVFAAAYPVLPHAFTTDAGVLGTIPHAWWFFVALQPVAGVVFALDGVLLGAGDAAFLRTATLSSAVLGYLPLIWVSLALDGTHRVHAPPPGVRAGALALGPVGGGGRRDPAGRRPLTRPVTGRCGESHRGHR
jgi:Na+-driven multidrug efflux pump